MKENFESARRRGKTYCPTFTAFIIQWVEFEANQRLAANSGEVMRRSMAMMVSLGLHSGQRSPPAAVKPLSRRRQRERRRRQPPLGPVVDTSLPAGLVALLDQAQAETPQRHLSRHAYLRHCVQQGLDFLDALQPRPSQ
jgi:hypothetical protein